MLHRIEDAQPRGSTPLADRRGAMRALVASAVGALAMATIGALGLLFDQPLLFPSLGPSIFILALTPDAPAAKSWNVTVGHAIGLCAGFASLFLFHAQSTPAVMIAQALSPERVAASTLAVASTIALQTFFCAAHPPAAATTLLIALGGLPPTGRTVATVALGVTLVALIGSAVRKRPLN